MLDQKEVAELGDQVNLEFRKFINAALSGELKNPEIPWKEENDLRTK